MKKTTEMKEYAVNLIFTHDLTKVIMQRKDRGMHAGKLNGPGGKLEEGEDMYGCARREILEETGIGDVSGLLWTGTLIPADEGVVLHFLAGTADEDCVKVPEGTEDCAWMRVRDVSIMMNTHPEKFAGDGDLRYFLLKSVRMLRERKEAGTP